MTWCPFCSLRVFNGWAAHPCCTLWERLRPGKACLACAVSVGHERELAARKQRPVLREGYTGPEPWRCGSCGLTDAGYERRQLVGMPIRPCRACAPHFEAVAA